MKKMMINFTKAMLIGMMALAGTTGFAQRRYVVHHPHSHGYYRSYRPVGPAVVTVVNRPAVTYKVNNQLNKRDRLEMALAYLKNNKTLSISKYSKITGLKSATAEAELDAFAVNDGNPIKMIMDGKKKLYIL